jgi:hypothetical protein
MNGNKRRVVGEIAMSPCGDVEERALQRRVKRLCQDWL